MTTSQAGRVYINTRECNGCGGCAALCPEIFIFHEDLEIAEVIRPEGGPVECIREAMIFCPRKCIYWEDTV
ncbi:MAG: ferredoxin [Deltaproteobacteria bacterium]|nr:ferredoxin [Deltaproteobacteria bacterium]